MSKRWCGPLPTSFMGQSLWYNVSHVKCIPMPFSETWQLCTKGPSRSSILGLFRAPHRSTSINAFELFFCCTVAFQYIYQKVYLLSTSIHWSAKSHEDASNSRKDPQPSSEASGACPKEILFCYIRKFLK